MPTDQAARILVVEKDALSAATIEFCLKTLGYEVCGLVTSGKKALEIAGRDSPDLVLTDIVLKGKMDGLELAQVIHSRWGIPVVIMTDDANSKRLKRAEVFYPFGYIVKPFQDSDIKFTIETARYMANLDEERRQAEERLREREESYRLVSKLTSDYICKINVDSRNRLVMQ